LPDILGTTHQLGKNITKYQQNIPNSRRIYINSRHLNTKKASNISIFFIPKPFKIKQNWDFGYENIPSGNPG
jgi:hypothetical protein